MTDVGNHIRCPQCGGKARVVWVSQDQETAAVSCAGYHSHAEERASSKTTSRYKTQPKTKIRKGMIFL
ncbi:MAG: hypothetical protein NWE77_03975, partial [Candidatus Bathyarchaeota archaeon]|nr:hypothetical protein [Candidatus Bathyarchaeota archaeon]